MIVHKYFDFRFYTENCIGINAERILLFFDLNGNWMYDAFCKWPKCYQRVEQLWE